MTKIIAKEYTEFLEQLKDELEAELSKISDKEK